MGRGRPRRRSGRKNRRRARERSPCLFEAGIQAIVDSDLEDSDDSLDSVAEDFVCNVYKAGNMKELQPGDDALHARNSVDANAILPFEDINASAYLTRTEVSTRNEDVVDDDSESCEHRRTDCKSRTNIPRYFENACFTVSSTSDEDGGNNNEDEQHCHIDMRISLSALMFDDSFDESVERNLGISLEQIVNFSCADKTENEHMSISVVHPQAALAVSDMSTFVGCKSVLSRSDSHGYGYLIVKDKLASGDQNGAGNGIRSPEELHETTSLILKQAAVKRKPTEDATLDTQEAKARAKCEEFLSLLTSNASDDCPPFNLVARDLQVCKILQRLACVMGMNCVLEESNVDAHFSEYMLTFSSPCIRYGMSRKSLSDIVEYLIRRMLWREEDESSRIAARGHRSVVNRPPRIGSDESLARAVAQNVIDVWTKIMLSTEEQFLVIVGDSLPSLWYEAMSKLTNTLGITFDVTNSESKSMFLPVFHFDVQSVREWMHGSERSVTIRALEDIFRNEVSVLHSLNAKQAGTRDTEFSMRATIDDTATPTKHRNRRSGRLNGLPRLRHNFSALASHFIQVLCTSVDDVPRHEVRAKNKIIRQALADFARVSGCNVKSTSGSPRLVLESETADSVPSHEILQENLERITELFFGSKPGSTQKCKERKQTKLDRQQRRQGRKQSKQHGRGVSCTPVPSTTTRAGRNALEKSTRASPIGQSNVGHQMLTRMGWQDGTGLGISESGRTAPLLPCFNVGRKGLGTS